MEDEKRTFDDILADADYKAEFDRRVAEALHPVQQELAQAQETNRQLMEQAEAREAPAKPPVQFTDRLSSGGSGGKTREEIAAIRDRAQRRAAIAANLHLFEGGN